MTSKITITKKKYEELKSQATAWRYAIGTSSNTAIFNAVRDNGGIGIESGVLAEKLRRIIENEK